MRAALLTGAAIPAGIAQAQLQVLDGPVAYQGHSYYFLSQSNWTDAEAAAVTLGGHLATINDAAENAFIFSRWDGFGGAPLGLWIGLNDAAVQFQFVWSSGEPSLYRDWAVEEPNNSGGNERYAHILWNPDPRAGHWNDAPNESAPFGPAMHGIVEVVCYANCDHSTTSPALDVGDFVCFLTTFAAQSPYANCDGSTTPPVLNVLDFVCFQQAFAAGCP